MYYQSHNRHACNWNFNLCNVWAPSREIDRFDGISRSWTRCVVRNRFASLISLRKLPQTAVLITFSLFRGVLKVTLYTQQCWLNFPNNNLVASYLVDCWGMWAGMNECLLSGYPQLSTEDFLQTKTRKPEPHWKIISMNFVWKWVLLKTEFYSISLMYKNKVSICTVFALSPDALRRL
jgi:hypothetical protein